MKKLSWEKIIVILLSFVMWGILTYFLFFLNIRNQVGDTTFVAQVLYNFKQTVRMQTTYYTSTTESIDHVWYKPAAEVCAMDLESKFTDTPWGHHYFIAYLLIPLARMMDIPLMIALLHAGIYTSLLVFVYVLARQKKLSILLAILFTVLVMQHPLWDQGLTGQLYFNRLFLPFSGLLILLLDRSKINYWLVFLAGMLAASTNEIYGITIFIMLCSYLWVYKKFDRKITIFAVIFLGFGVLSTAYIQSHFPLGSTQTSSLGSLFGHGLDGIFRSVWMRLMEPTTQTFLAVNFLALGGFAQFNFRLILPLLMILGPNVLVTVGGAEKIGWSTHYHTGYFIPLIWISLIGLSKLNNRPRAQAVLIGAAIIFTMWVNPATLRINEQPTVVIKKLIQSVRYQHQKVALSLDFRRRLREAVGEGSTLSVPEAVAYNLFDHKMYYYPMGIDSVNAVILRYDGTKTADQRLSSINYGQQDPNLDSCILDRMKKGGFDFDNLTIVDEWAVIKRKTIP